MLMVTQPVKVVRSSGTIISIDVSLGYDIERSKISELLCLAVDDAGLSESFVQIRELGDFSITYRAAGRVKDTLSLLSVKSSLYGYALDRLHGAKIEIVSPNFMNTRTVQDIQIIPKKSSRSAVEKSDGNVGELIFEKAEKASAINNITTELHKLSVALDNDEEPLAESDRESNESKIEQLKVELKIKQELLDEDDIAPEKADHSSSSQLPS
jgi:small conductance mechanosensitive channel